MVSVLRYLGSVRSVETDTLSMVSVSAVSVGDSIKTTGALKRMNNMNDC